jgi:hypothetical protein
MHKLTDPEKQNFETLKTASNNGGLALVSSRRKRDGAEVALVCAMNVEEHDGEKMLCPVPLAVLIEGNPYEDFEDPTILES